MPSVPKPATRAPTVRKPVKKRNVKRAKANHERAYGEKADWIRGNSCAVCCWPAPSEAAHIGSGGTSRKGDASTLLPLCGPRLTPYGFLSGLNPGDAPKKIFTKHEGCHAESHRGIKTFEKAHGGISLKQRAADYEAKYQAFISLRDQP